MPQTTSHYESLYVCIDGTCCIVTNMSGDDMLVVMTVMIMMVMMAMMVMAVIITIIIIMRPRKYNKIC